MQIPAIPSATYEPILDHWHEWVDFTETWTPPNSRHPRLFQPAGDVDLVRWHAEEVGLVPGLEKAFRAAADEPLPTAFDDPSPVVAWSARLVACADWYLVSGDKDGITRACEIVKYLAKCPRWVPDQHLPLTIDLSVAHVMRSLARAFDRMHGGMTDEQRAFFVELIMKRGIEPFVEISDQHSEWWTYSVHNWRSVVCAEICLAALSISEYMPVALLRRALKHAVIGQLAVLDQGGDDGGWYEGVSYWRMGIGVIVQFADVLYRVTGGQLNLFTHPFLSKTGDFGLHMTWSDGNVYHWADCGEKVVASDLMIRLASAQKRGDWQAYVDRFGFTPSMDTLFWDENPPKAMKWADIPRVKTFFGAGAATIRAGWEKNDLTLGIKAGKTTANHSHLDVASFQLRGFGETFIDDGGHWDYAHSLGMFKESTTRWDFPGLATECHSSVLVDGQGQQWGDGREGQILACADRGDWAFATIDGSTAYPQIERFVRYFLVLFPGVVERDDGDTLVVIDEFVSPDPHRFGWRAVINGDVERRSASEWAVKTTAKGPGMTVKCLWPAPEAGLMSEITDFNAAYEATGGNTVEKDHRFLTVTPFIRERERFNVFAMKIGKKGAPDVNVRAEEAYRSVRIIADVDGTERTWQVMWGTAGVAEL